MKKVTAKYIVILNITPMRIVLIASKYYRGVCKIIQKLLNAGKGSVTKNIVTLKTNTSFIVLLSEL